MLKASQKQEKFQLSSAQKSSMEKMQCTVCNGLVVYLRRGQEKIPPVWIVNTDNMSVLLGPRLSFNPVGSQRCPSPLAQAQGG